MIQELGNVKPHGCVEPFSPRSSIFHTGILDFVAYWDAQSHECVHARHARYPGKGEAMVTVKG